MVVTATPVPPAGGTPHAGAAGLRERNLFMHNTEMARKRKAARAQRVGRAGRKERERERKGKQPTGAPLHTGELRHRQLLSHGDGGTSGNHGRP